MVQSTKYTNFKNSAMPVYGFMTPGKWGNLEMTNRFLWKEIHADNR